MEAINNVTNDYEFRIEPIKREELNTEFSNQFFYENTESNLKIFHQPFSELWKKTISFHASILQITKKQVYCDCLIDKENGFFETRVFPKELFEHLQNIAEKALVVIRIQTKPGSSRIDVFDGKGIVDPATFEVNDIFDSLKNSGLDNSIAFENG